MKRLFYVFTLVTGSCLAQDLVLHDTAPGPGMGPHVRIMGLEGAFPGKNVKNAPFTGKQITTETQTLADGNRITHTNTAQFYRDASGRLRIERTFSGIGPWSGGSAKTMIEIHDSVAGLSYVLDPSNQTASKLSVPKMNYKLSLDGHASGAPAVTTENLGTQTINGFACTGKRVTETIAAGEVGNDQPIVSVTETWYSPELQMNIQSKRSDPRMGQIETHFESLSRTAPDPSLFQVPSNYTVSAHSGKMVDEMYVHPPPAN